MKGPIDYIIVGFEGSTFDGSILRELQKSVDAGIIAVLAIKVIAKNDDGTVTALDITGDALAVATTFNLSENLVTEEDVYEVGELLDNNTAAGLLIVEHLWAWGLKQAIQDANGRLIVDGRIHPDALEELNALEAV